MEQLNALRNQIEEDYRQDIAAVERLQRRFVAPSANGPTTSVSTINTAPAAAPATPSFASPAPATESHESVWPLPQVKNQPDELTGSLRAMFSGRA